MKRAVLSGILGAGLLLAPAAFALDWEEADGIAQALVDFATGNVPTVPGERYRAQEELQARLTMGPRSVSGTGETQAEFSLDGLDPQGEARPLTGVLSTRNGRVYSVRAGTLGSTSDDYLCYWLWEYVRGNAGFYVSADTMRLRGKVTVDGDGTRAKMAIRFAYRGVVDAGPGSGAKSRGRMKFTGLLDIRQPE